MQVNMYNAKTHLSALVNKALAGEEVIIARDGKPMVSLTPVVAPRKPSSRGTLACKLTVPDDFDTPMPDEWFEDPSDIKW